MIVELKDLKDTYETARLLIDRGKEPMEDLLKIQDFLSLVAADPSLVTEKASPDFKRYFLEDFTTGLLKRLTKERSRDDKVKQMDYIYMRVVLGSDSEDTRILHAVVRGVVVLEHALRMLFGRDQVPIRL